MVYIAKALEYTRAKIKFLCVAIYPLVMSSDVRYRRYEYIS